MEMRLVFITRRIFFIHIDVDILLRVDFMLRREDIVMRDVTQEKLILSQMYNNTADAVKFLPFFFQDKKELRRFFNQFGGKTLILPETYDEFLQYLLRCSVLPDDKNRQGIDERIHSRTKEKILETYINLFKSLEDVIKSECESI